MDVTRPLSSQRPSFLAAPRIGAPLPKAEALAEAKAWLRTYEDESGRRHYEHPYYWSAFILIGDRS